MGRLHTRSFPSITGADGLGYGPRAAGGDPFTEDAADGGLDASTGPSWRMIAALGVRRGYRAGRVPGRAVGEPGLAVVRRTWSPLWWDGKYLPVPVPGLRRRAPTVWRLDG